MSFLFPYFYLKYIYIRFIDPFYLCKIIFGGALFKRKFFVLLQLSVNVKYLCLFQKLYIIYNKILTKQYLLLLF